MCFCNPEIKSPYCGSFICQSQLLRHDGIKPIETLEDKTARLKARLQLIWEWIETVNKATGIEPPEEFFKWFDDNGKPL